jgi:hypothetical protein
VAASVQGYEFDSAIVTELTAVDAADVEERLETLEHVYGFVRRSREQELPDGTLSVRYRFVHVLYQNALYAGSRRRGASRLSARGGTSAARPLRDRSGDIAAEPRSALRAARDTRRAVEHLVVAAQNAARVFANQEAVAFEAGARPPRAASRHDGAGRARLYLQSAYAAALGALKGWRSRTSGRRRDARSSCGSSSARGASCSAWAAGCGGTTW